MFGGTLNIGSGGNGKRGRKKGFELPNHKWIAKIPTPNGGFRYIYTQAELAAAKGQKTISNVGKDIEAKRRQAKRDRVVNDIRGMAGGMTKAALSAAANTKAGQKVVGGYKKVRDTQHNLNEKRIDLTYKAKNSNLGPIGGSHRKVGESNLQYLRRRVKNKLDRNVNNKIDLDDFKRLYKDHEGDFTKLKVKGYRGLRKGYTMARLGLKKGAKAARDLPGKIRDYKMERHNKQFEGNRYTDEERAAYERRKREFNKNKALRDSANNIKNWQEQEARHRKVEAERDEYNKSRANRKAAKNISKWQEDEAYNRGLKKVSKAEEKKNIDAIRKRSSKQAIQRSNVEKARKQRAYENEQTRLHTLSNKDKGNYESERKHAEQTGMNKKSNADLIKMVENTNDPTRLREAQRELRRRGVRR